MVRGMGKRGIRGKERGKVPQWYLLKQPSSCILQLSKWRLRNEGTCSKAGCKGRTWSLCHRSVVGLWQRNSEPIG